ncbi:hypothetical protein TNIN_70271 [Trichonephila inaurata madagascariensis]|uniref:Uncharacterized protein n=1 Tax=Trichonephila inaurata madagascariensis TaxID=2747483 RepID=A0A8X6WYY5_9ARAC|nr:hypothetical protein TNIN_70271 [Trichonephila inaurata madagascariensis]
MPPWTDEQFQVVDHKTNPIGWISLNMIVSNIERMMSQVEICTQLPFPLLLGFDWHYGPLISSAPTMQPLESNQAAHNLI